MIGCARGAVTGSHGTNCLHYSLINPCVISYSAWWFVGGWSWLTHAKRRLVAVSAVNSLESSPQRSAHSFIAFIWRTSTEEVVVWLSSCWTQSLTFPEWWQSPGIQASSFKLCVLPRRPTMLPSPVKFEPVHDVDPRVAQAIRWCLKTSNKTLRI